MKIAVIGMGYVGLANAFLLSQYHEVIAVDCNQRKVNCINEKKVPIKDSYMLDFWRSNKLSLIATTSIQIAIKEALLVLVAIPTNFCLKTKHFDMNPMEEVIKEIITYNPEALIVIKSTVPIGFTKKISKKYSIDNLIFSPEFLREGFALYDNLYPQRIIVGEKSSRGEKIAQLYLSCTKYKNSELLLTDASEAEAIKFFANTFLALRVSFFNELDMFAQENHLNSQEIIHGVSLDSRIGNYYNHPSFGYGGICLPKDVNQLISQTGSLHTPLIKSIPCSNRCRKHYIAREVLKRSPKTVGIYRLVMKKDSDNFRDAAILDIIDYISQVGVQIIVHEPILANEVTWNNYLLCDLSTLKIKSDSILANIWNEELADVKSKVYTRDY